MRPRFSMINAFTVTSLSLRIMLVRQTTQPLAKNRCGTGLVTSSLMRHSCSSSMIQMNLQTLVIAPTQHSGGTIREVVQDHVKVLRSGFLWYPMN
ncbi:hypothetical protein CGRA01v4_13503, partial [Colletotrichum graminicola]